LRAVFGYQFLRLFACVFFLRFVREALVKESFVQAAGEFVQGSFIEKKRRVLLENGFAY
jgi:hypothetical protein